MKRYQTVSIEKDNYFSGKKTKRFIVCLHDRRGIDGIFYVPYYTKSKKRLIALLRSDDIEVSKHVENGGKLRLY